MVVVVVGGVTSRVSCIHNVKSGEHTEQTKDLHNRTCQEHMSFVSKRLGIKKIRYGPYLSNLFISEEVRS